MTFISPFIKGFSHLTKPLRDVLKSNVGSFNNRWGPSQEEAFANLKKVAANDIIKRGFFNELHKTILYTDASPWGLGAVLTQESESGEKFVIACASKSLTSTESKYPQLHREALAIVWAMARFSYFLLGRKFVLRSDSKALMFMIKPTTNKDSGKRVLTRAEGWFLRLQYYDFEFEHIPG